MKLQSLYIKGFKSFANETLLHFNEDVIGVVGPNGSGKSNIVDAIRWVLGEQKGKDLRLESMSDVIFNGTKKRKEAAAAIVSLTFENTKYILPVEYNTVTISRILYRNGESEYRLNNVVCRLKDINSLFMDTGIGSNSYAIIVLGMVDDILADKENARRKMFEQAAGVSKYKIRKRETQNKLKSAEEDLNRIDDLLFEIEGNLKTLEKQAKRTKKYNELKEHYKTISVKHAIHSIQSLKEEYKSTTEQIRNEQDKYKALDAEIYTLQASLEKEKKKHLDKEEEVSRKQKGLGELVSNIRNLENDKSLILQNIGFKQQTIQNIQKQSEQTLDDLNQLYTDTKVLASGIEEEIAVHSELKHKFIATEAAYTDSKTAYHNAKSSFDNYQIQKQALDRQIFENEKQIAIFGNTIDNAEKENRRLTEELSHRDSAVYHSRKAIGQINTELKVIQGKLSVIQSKEEDRKNSISKLESERDTLIDKLNICNRIIDAKQHEFDLLKSMIENYEGFPESVKFLADNWNKSAALLTDVIQVEEKYKAAIEQYLELYLNYFIVENISEAVAAIRLLKDGQRGKANFFILDKVKQVPEKLDFIPLMTPAVNVVKSPEKYTHLVQWLLYNVYITDDNIQNFNPDPQWDDCIFLSSSGIYQKTRFSFSGGSVGLFEGKRIGRKQNLEKLDSEIVSQTKLKVKFESELSSIQKQLNDLKQIEFQKDINSSISEINKLEQSAVKLKVEIDNFEKFRADTEHNFQHNKDLILRNQNAIQNLNVQIAELYNRINELSTGDISNDQHLNSLYHSMTQATELFNAEHIQIIRHQNKLDNLTKDLRFKEGRVQEYHNKLNQDKNRLTSEEKQVIDLNDQLTALDEKLSLLYNEKNNYQNTLSEAEQIYFRARSVINEQEEQIRQLTRSQNQMQNQIQQLKDRFTECKFQINAVGERLRIEFDLHMNELINTEPEPDTNAEELGLEVEKLRLRILSFGEINPLALEAYNEINERYVNIQTQRKDILEAKDSLQDTIKEIEQTATQKFLDAFEKVRGNFINVFRSLFTEDDTCDLILLSPENPLESDIEIIAKPKGKKPRSLAQLSGGEKTLTATALLFALYLLKPAPFCIFDEVDAPLDDANIQKFNNIVKTFSKDSQFIIVTHNKSTMAEVDILYGVFMDEPGVSSVSAVDFRAFRHEPILETINGAD